MSRLLRQTLCVLSAALTVAASAALTAPVLADAPTTIYVNPSGQDMATCGSSSAFTCATIQYAVAERALTPGDVVSVASGSYAEALSITTPLTLTSGAGETATITGTVDVGDAAGDVTVNGFTIGSAAGGALVSVHDTNAAGHVTISDNTFTGGASQQTAVSATSTTALTVTGNHITSGTAPFVGVEVDADTSTTEQVVTGNTFTLGSGGGSAIDLTATGAGTTLEVTLGGNTGSVAAPTGTITQSGDGTIAVTASAPNTITPDPAPTLAVAVPTRIAPGVPAQQFTGVLDANDATVAHARYHVVIAGSSALTADQLTMQYDPGSGLTDLPLSGTANAGGIVGDFGQAGGFAIAPADHITIPFTLAADGAAPIGPFTVTISLDEVSPGSDSTALNTIASTTNPSAIDAAPVATPMTIDAPLQGATPVVLAATDADNDPLTYSVTTQPMHGQLAGTPPNLTYTPARTSPGGTDSFTFTASDGSDTSAPATVTMNVAADHQPVVSSQPTITVAYRATKSITVQATDADADSLTYHYTQPGFGRLSGSGPVLKYQAPIGRAGTTSFTFTASDGRTGGTSNPVTVHLVVAKGATGLSVAISPMRPTSATAPRATITVTSAGNPNGGRVTVKFGSRTRSAHVSGGKASVFLVHYTGGVHRLSATFATNATAAAATATKTFTVSKVKSTLKFSTNPLQLTTKTRKGRAIVTVSAPGASVNGARVTIKEGSRTIGSGIVSHGRATITLPRLSLGQHNWTVSYPGTSTATAASRPAVARVALG